MNRSGSNDPISLEVFSYRLPLIAPVVIYGVEKTHAEGWLLRVETDAGIRWGDVAPLAGYSVENPGEVGRILSELRKTVSDLSGLDVQFPSVQWGMDAARPVSLQCPAGTSVPIARLIQRGSIADTERATQAALDAGFRTLKFKVGGRNVEDDIAMVRRVASMLPPESRIRLDANRSWCIEEATRFGAATEGLPIAYVEEPLKDISLYAQLEQRTSMPLALDESLARAPEVLQRDWTNLAALVLKPTLLGGHAALARLFDWARDHGVYTVISSMYESGVGIRALLALAAEKTPGVAVGLDTYGMLAEDVVIPRLVDRNGAWISEQADPHNWTVDVTKLERWE
jgi:O-succinylbenzoate synthase